jgi:hypothetical protein
METDDLVCQIGIETHGWGEGYREVRGDAHKEGAECGDGGCSGDEIAIDFYEAEVVFGVVGAGGVDGVIAYACCA